MKDDAVIFSDDNGYPVIFAATAVAPQSREAGPPVASEEPPAPSEVDQPPTPPRETSTKPQEVAWEEWHRRQENVRTAAREFEPLGNGDLREFLQGKTTRDLSDEEV